MVFRRFCMGMKCLYCTIGRTTRTVPPSPEISPPRYKLVPVFGKYGLSTVLNEKLGRILLVTMPERIRAGDAAKGQVCKQNLGGVADRNYGRTVVRVSQTHALE